MANTKQDFKDNRSEELTSAIERVKKSGRFSYAALGRELGISKQRVQVLAKVYHLDNWRKARLEATQNILNDVIKDNELMVNQSIHNLAKNLHTSKRSIEKLIDAQGLNVQIKKTKKKTKFDLLIEEVISEGFIVKDNTSQELHKYLLNKGYNYSIHTLRCLLSQSKTDFKKVGFHIREEQDKE